MQTASLAQLNPQQLEAATHLSGPLLVIAGAGTGKTKTLIHRLAWLVDQGICPQRILLLTFTRRAASEMLKRAGRLKDRAIMKQVWGGTFHAIAVRLLRQHGRGLGLSPDFTVIDRGDAADLMNMVRSDCLATAARKRLATKDTLVAIYSRAVNSQTPLRPLLTKQFPWCQDNAEIIGQIFEKYTRRKRQHHILD